MASSDYNTARNGDGDGSDVSVSISTEEAWRSAYVGRSASMATDPPPALPHRPGPDLAILAAPANETEPQPQPLTRPEDRNVVGPYQTIMIHNLELYVPDWLKVDWAKANHNKIRYCGPPKYPAVDGGLNMLDRYNVDSLLIATAGTEMKEEDRCGKCKDRMEPFHGCVKWDVLRKGACANCVMLGEEEQCSLFERDTQHVHLSEPRSHYVYHIGRLEEHGEGSGRR
ncbi:hypothetical protein Hte_005871 [Hypoxylon texense]